MIQAVQPKIRPFFWFRHRARPIAPKMDPNGRLRVLRRPNCVPCTPNPPGSGTGPDQGLGLFLARSAPFWRGSPPTCVARRGGLQRGFAGILKRACVGEQKHDLARGLARSHAFFLAEIRVVKCCLLLLACSSNLLGEGCSYFLSGTARPPCRDHTCLKGAFCRFCEHSTCCCCCYTQKRYWQWEIMGVDPTSLTPATTEVQCSMHPTCTPLGP